LNYLFNWWLRVVSSKFAEKSIIIISQSYST